jgi:hypothetical protein
LTPPQKATDNMDDFSQMAAQIEGLASLLSRYRLGSSEVPEGIRDRVDGISRYIPGFHLCPSSLQYNLKGNQSHVGTYQCKARCERGNTCY